MSGQQITSPDHHKRALSILARAAKADDHQAREFGRLCPSRYVLVHGEPHGPETRLVYIAPDGAMLTSLRRALRAWSEYAE